MAKRSKRMKKLIGDPDAPLLNWFDNFCNRVGYEATMDDEHSYAQATCNRVADVSEAALGATVATGSFLDSTARSATSSAYNAGQSAAAAGQNYHDWAQSLSNPENGIYPYTRFRDDGSNE